jgi:lysophospholipase L1-like esterase/MoaA/NifB/PqqE/SkfB family radical SAM enzyme
MENPCKIVLFGDSITKGYAKYFPDIIKERHPDKDIEVIKEGISGETTRDGLKRIGAVIDMKPDVVITGFGMNDWRKGVDEQEYKKNLLDIIGTCEKNHIRVLLLTISPYYEGFFKPAHPVVEGYNRIIKTVAREKKVKIADVAYAFRKKFRVLSVAMRDSLHPNGRGYKLIAQTAADAVSRRNTTVLWQYNGREAKCNYRCPYCYYIGLHNPEDNFIGTIEQWHRGFKSSFGNQHLVFYLAFGEPTIGEAFFNVVEMVESEPNWELRITSNVSSDMRKIVKTRLAREGRININASFHPLAAEREEFIKNIVYLRENGIEVPVVYVAYPPFLKRLEDDIHYFSEEHWFAVHVRRFQGYYKKQKYPYAYTEEERQLIAKYMDDNSIKYMLNQQFNYGDFTYTGVHFFVCDNVGNVGYDSNVFRPYTKYRCIFGNVLQGNFKPLLRPGRYPGYHEGTVDGIAHLVDARMNELEGNNVLSFMKQGGVYKAGDTVHYKHLLTDFQNSRIRAEYNFPARNMKDGVSKLFYTSAETATRVKKLYKRAERKLLRKMGLKKS